MNSSKTHIRILFNVPHADVDQLWIYYAAKPASSSFTNLVIFTTVTQCWKPTTGYLPLIHRRICCHLKNLSYMQLHSNGPNSSLLHIIGSNSLMYQILWGVEFFDASKSMMHVSLWCMSRYRVRMMVESPKVPKVPKSCPSRFTPWLTNLSQGARNNLTWQDPLAATLVKSSLVSSHSCWLNPWSIPIQAASRLPS